MSLQQIGKNGTSEFFEEITFGLGNELDVVSALPETDINLINEAMQSGVTVMKMGVMMYVLQLQEQRLERILDVLFAGIAVTLSGIGSKLKKGLSGIKGMKFIRKMQMFGGTYSDNINLCRLGSELALNSSNKSTGTNNALDRYSVGIKQKQSLIAQDEHRLNLAQSKSSNYTQSLMFKLMSGGFTVKDRTLIKKILGKDSAKLDIDDLNKVSSFMFVKDSAGNLTGLSEEFMTLINGLGYLHNKGK